MHLIDLLFNSFMPLFRGQGATCGSLTLMLSTEQLAYPNCLLADHLSLLLELHLLVVWVLDGQAPDVKIVANGDNDVDL